MIPTPLGPQHQPPVPSSLQSALAMDPAQQQQHMQMVGPPPPQPTASASTTGKRRRKAGEDGGDAPAPSEPRRLRRSHEACARCRSKKIKCDSKHPRCTACATAGTQCNQEDRHRQTLTPRGHVEHIEHQLAQCEALLKLRYPGFTLENLDEYISRENIDPATIPTAPSLAPVYQFDGNGRVSGGGERPPKGYPPLFQPPPPPPPGYPPYHMMPPGPPYGPPYPQMPMQPHPGPFSPHMHPGPPFQHPGHPPYPPPPGVMPHHGPPLPGMAAPPPPPAQQPSPAPVPPPVAAAPPAAGPQPSASKGTDPNGNDMSNTDALAKNFGVNEAIFVGSQVESTDPEDFAVGSNGLASGRDRSAFDVPPRVAEQWIQVSARRNSVAGAVPNTLALSRPIPHGPIAEVWLPKDRNLANHVVETYFTHLNLHRPVFDRKEFQKIIDDLYDGKSVYDPGYICSVYLVFALGTLSDLNHRAEADGPSTDAAPNISSVAQKLMPSWPQHDEFFQRALAVKPDLRVTVTSLQALILLHWYLYTERQGRTLWRLVGSLVRLSIELGLHHDPTLQKIDKSQDVFTEDECQLRIRLWGIVLIHDRGTSILLGRPLAISPSDANTPRPSRPFKARLTDFSEHFELSHPIAEIQADIINSLYTPKKQAPDTLMRNATRIIKSMSEFRRSLPDRYKFYFAGTEEWPEEDRLRLVEKITEDEGLTLLKLGIARILLLRALFNNKDLDYSDRKKALTDAVITSHNIIVIHNQLIRFPNIAFFTSPIPLHIAAMVILFGHMSDIPDVPFNTAVEDLWLALDMVPRFRWRWERKDFGGAHPLLARLAEMVMRVNLREFVPSGKPVLMCEKDWDDNSSSSPVAKSQQNTPTMPTIGAPYSHPPVTYGPQVRAVASSVNGSHSGSSGNSTPHDKQLVDLPNNLFYPFYPEDARAAASSADQGYGHLLAQAGAAHGHGGSYDSYMSEERDIAHPHPLHATASQQQQQQAQQGQGQPGQQGMWVTVPAQAQTARPVYASHS